MSLPSQSIDAPSIPARYRAPRPLNGIEFSALRAIADVLIPATDRYPAGSAEQGFDQMLLRATDARADAFSVLTEIAREAPTAAGELESYLRKLHDHEPARFQVVSAVVTESWLLTESVRDRIGYHGQQRHPAGLEDAANDLMDGILEPVLAMEAEIPARWAR